MIEEEQMAYNQSTLSTSIQSNVDRLSVYAPPLMDFYRLQ